mgnify:CR=1 FL=1
MEDEFDRFVRKVLRDMLRDIEEVERMFGMRMPRFSIRFPEENISIDIDRTPKRPPARKKILRGVSISISSKAGRPPTVEVKEYTPETGWRKVPLGEEREATATAPAPRAKRFPCESYATVACDLRIIPTEVIITVKAPGVESADNVQLSWGRESVEVVCYSPKEKKGYFAVARVPVRVRPADATVEVSESEVVIRVPRQR